MGKLTQSLVSLSLIVGGLLLIGDWKVAVGVFMVVWANNLDLDLRKDKQQ